MKNRPTDVSSDTWGERSGLKLGFFEGGEA